MTPTDAIDTARVIDAGDSVRLARDAYEWKEPLTVVDADVIDWQRNGERAWSTATVQLTSGRARCSDHYLEIIEDRHALWMQGDMTDELIRLEPVEELEGGTDGSDEAAVDEDEAVADKPADEQAAEEFLENVADATSLEDDDQDGPIHYGGLDLDAFDIPNARELADAVCGATSLHEICRDLSLERDRARELAIALGFDDLEAGRPAIAREEAILAVERAVGTILLEPGGHQ